MFEWFSNYMMFGCSSVVFYDVWVAACIVILREVFSKCVFVVKDSFAGGFMKHVLMPSESFL